MIIVDLFINVLYFHSWFKENVIATTWRDGPYLLVVAFHPNKQDVNWNLTCMTRDITLIMNVFYFSVVILSVCLCYHVSYVYISVSVVMKGTHGFLSVTEWPLMIVSIAYQFFIMCSRCLSCKYKHFQTCNSCFYSLLGS